MSVCNHKLGRCYFCKSYKIQCHAYACQCVQRGYWFGWDVVTCPKNDSDATNLVFQSLMSNVCVQEWGLWVPRCLRCQFSYKSWSTNQWEIDSGRNNDVESVWEIRCFLVLFAKGEEALERRYRLRFGYVVLINLHFLQKTFFLASGGMLLNLETAMFSPCFGMSNELAVRLGFELEK